MLVRGQRGGATAVNQESNDKKSTTGLSDRDKSSFDAGKAVARVAKCVDRAGRRMA